MKKLLFIVLVFICASLNAQEVVMQETQEINMSKDALFSKTKMFISDSWTNTKHSIQNEDKDLGVIQVKTEKEIAVKAGMGLSCVYIYEYMTKFRVKDNKFRVEIYDVKCTSAEQMGLGKSYKIPLIQYFEGEKPLGKTKSAGKGVSTTKAFEMMEELRNEFKTIVELYLKQMKVEDNF